MKYSTENGITITIADLPFAISVVQSPKRKRTISIEVKEKEIVIRTPLQTSMQSIQQLIDQRRAWIEKAALKQMNQAASLEWKLFGQPLRIQMMTIRTGVRPRVTLSHIAESTLCIAIPDKQNQQYQEQSYIDCAVREWLKAKAKHEFTLSTDNWAQKMQLSYGKITIKSQSTRWGSCSRLGNLNYNWRLIQAPSHVFDYIVVHELCHLREFNHSPAFWRLVAQWIPTYMEDKQWLYKFGHTLRGA